MSNWTKPHEVNDKISINNARTTINLLTRPLIEIKKNFEDNIKLCQDKKNEIEMSKANIEELRKTLFIPHEEIEQIDMDAPATVCGDKNCCFVSTINGNTMIKYEQKCHSACCLENIEHKIFGDQSLLECEAFRKTVKIGAPKWADKNQFIKDQNLKRIVGNRAFGVPVKVERSENCFQCGHSYQTHLYIRYETGVVRREIRNESVYQSITTREETKKAQENMISALEERISNFQNERNRIKTYIVKFTVFLNKNAITSFNDAYEEYVLYLIKSGAREKEDLELVLKEHREEKEEYQRILDQNVNTEVESEISAERINSCIEELFKMEFSGELIRNGLTLQKNSLAKERTLKEITHNIRKKGDRIVEWIENIFHSL